jgi:beta-lactamase superfamily II metal-dependent hydrolase
VRTATPTTPELERWRWLAAAFAAVLVLTVVAPATVSAPAAAAASPAAACSSSGTWIEGELNVYWFDVEQGDAQLIVGPTGRTMLIDLGERAWNSTSDTMAQRVAATISAICGTSGPVHLDYVMASHLHLDHIGYAGNPHDTSAYGNGIYELLHPDGLAFTVGELITRDAGHWDGSRGDGDGDCEVGTNAEPSPEIVWVNAGTTSSTARRWVCWTGGPAGQRDRAHIDGKVTVLTGSPWPSFDLGPGVNADVVLSDADGVMQADGVTPVQGDHTAESTPPSENDYSIGIRFQYGDYVYATAGDTDGEYATSGYNYTYNDVEAAMIGSFGDVATMRVNHHGSSHSSSQAYVDALAPETAVIQCGANSYGHPANRVLDVLRQVVTSEGVGADVYLTNNPCDTDESDGTPIDYTGTFNANGDIWLRTTGGGAGYDVVYDAGTNTYTTATAPSGVRIAEARFRGPAGATDEFIELVNVGGDTVDISGWVLQGCAGGSGAPSARATVPAGTTLAGGQRYLVAHDGYSGAAPADLTYATGIADTGGTRIVDGTGAVVDGVGSSDGSVDECREGAGLAFPTGDEDVSFHRGDDGRTDTDDNPADFTGPAASTPTNATGDTAGGGGTGTVDDLVINEYVADNAAFPAEWVELHNPTSADVDASGLWIDDLADAGSSPQQLPGGSVIVAGGHLVFELSGYVLNNGGDDVRLLTGDQAAVIDAHSYTSSADDLSYQRSPDGGAWCPEDGPASQGTSNAATCP